MIKELVNAQREYFLTGETLSVGFRLAQLKKLRAVLLSGQNEIFDAFMSDYNKSPFDVVSTELGMVINEIDFMARRLKRLARPKRVGTDLFNFPSSGKIIYEPYGTALIMAPWNYPLQLSLLPLVGALAAGNTAVVKPASYAPAVAACIKKLLSVFDAGYVAAVTGGREQNQELLDQKFDFIFFTGSEEVGRQVMQKAAAHLTPVVLELGGKSPCIVDETADLGLAAKRVAWGKFLNAGQTCVAPDHALVHQSVADDFLPLLIEQTQKMFMDGGAPRKEFTHIINDKHVMRLKKLIDPAKTVMGGQTEGRLVYPTIMTNVTRGDPVMREEIFGPILPVLTYDNFDALVYELKRLPKPLALYYFGKNKKHIDKLLSEVSFGGGAVNDTVMHLTNHRLPFGGVGASGMGAYHGEKSFQTFSHAKSVLIKSKAEINLKYPPVTDKKFDLVRLVTKTKK